MGQPDEMNGGPFIPSEAAMSRVPCGRAGRYGRRHVMPLSGDYSPEGPL